MTGKRFFLPTEQDGLLRPTCVEGGE